jgi:hypothetical protein
MCQWLLTAIDPVQRDDTAKEDETVPHPHSLLMAMAEDITTTALNVSTTTLASTELPRQLPPL